MKNKKGFTLAEILAVIALISLVMFLVVPSIINLYNSGQKSAFYDEVLNIYNHTSATYISRVTEEDYSKRFCVGQDKTTNPLEIAEKKNLWYDVLVNSDGEVIGIKVMNNKFNITLSNEVGINKKNIKIDAIRENTSSDYLYCEVAPVSSLYCIIDDNIRKCYIWPFDYLISNKTL